MLLFKDPLVLPPSVVVTTVLRECFLHPMKRTEIVSLFKPVLGKHEEGAQQHHGRITTKNDWSQFSSEANLSLHSCLAHWLTLTSFVAIAQIIQRNIHCLSIVLPCLPLLPTRMSSLRRPWDGRRACSERVGSLARNQAT